MGAAMRSLEDDLFGIYSRAGREVTYVTERGETRPYWANRYMQALKRAVDEAQNGRTNAVVEFVERLVNQPEPSRGFFYLHAAMHLDLSVEAHVADASKPYHHLFSAEAIEISIRRLDEYGYHVDTVDAVGPAVPPLVGLHYAVVADKKKSSAERLSSLMSLELNLADFKRVLVRDAHSGDVSWKEIGLRLGVSEEDAKAMFGIRLSNGQII